MRKISILPAFCWLFLPLISSANDSNEQAFELSLQALLDVEVTSVSKQRQPLSDAPAAIYVISSEDIKRSGATSIPQALRDVPGLHVAQIDSQKWAVSSRGFNGRYNNKLLVMMDGRTLYSPGFSGVYWEAQDTLMADIERIEIIRGPSAAMWGANAVNGVINIITKHSADTLGGYAELGVGDYEQSFAGFRYGGKLADDVTARAYAKGFKRDSYEHSSQDLAPSQRPAVVGIDTDNSWHQVQAGGRIDMKLGQSSALTLSSDIYRSQINQVYYVATLTPPYRQYALDEFDSHGWNVLAKYTKALSATSEYTLQAYYDYARREEKLFGYATDTLDIDFQYQFQAWQRHNIIWGLGYRYIKDDLDTDPAIFSNNLSQSTNLWSAFVRDEITLSEDALWLTLATRVEHNSYTETEWQPNVRLMWKLNEQHKLWSSVAYSVRTPSRAETSLTINANTFPPAPPFVPVATTINITGNDQYDSEKLLAYELGYRFEPTNTFSIDAAAFYNDYNDLRGTSIDPGDATFAFLPVPHAIQPVLFDNSEDGRSYGFELSSQWLVTNRLKFKFNYGFINSVFGDTQTQNTDAPKHIVSLNADWAVHKDVDINMTWRYVDEATVIDTLTSSDVHLDSYHGVDIGISWQVSPDVSLSVFGKNLFYSDHVEFEVEQFHIPYRVEPSYYGKITLNF